MNFFAMYVHHLCVGFIIGAVFGYQSINIPYLAAFLLFCAVLLILRCFPQLFKVFIGICLGYLWIWLILAHWEAGALPEQAWGKSYEVVIDIDRSDEGLIISPEPMVVRWQCNSCKTRLAPGRWMAQATLKPLQTYANLGGHDPQASRMRSGVRAMAELSEVQLHVDNAHRVGLKGFRYKLAEYIRSGDYSMKPLLLGLILGDKTMLKPEHWQILRDTGTSHLLAISGLHLTMVATVIYTIIFWIMRFMLWQFPAIPAKPIAWFISWMLTYPYVVLTGEQISAWRAYIMLGCMTFIILGRRSQFMFKDLSIVVVLVLLIQPYALGSISLWLSVGAMALLLLIGHQFDAMPRCYQMIVMQWRMSLALGLLACMMMHTMSVSSPLANIIAIPYVSFIVVPLCFVAMLIYMASPILASFVMKAADLSLEPLWRGLQALSSLSSAPVIWISTPWQWLCAFLFIGLCAMPASKNTRIFGLVLWVGILCPIPPHPNQAEAWVDVLDVGQGLAVVVRTRTHVLVYDTGAGFLNKTVAEFTLLPFLHHEHIKHIHTLMISHADSDHRGGYAMVKQTTPIGLTLSGEPRDADEQPCEAGQHWRWDEVDFAVLSPRAGSQSDHNNRSCVLKISTGTHAVLLTGDIEAVVERILSADRALKADILVVPHHGSKTSSTPAFLAQVQPQHAIVSAGLLNRYHHPHPDIVRRYEAQGIKLWNTAQSGAMHVRISRSGAKVTGFKESHT